MVGIGNMKISIMWMTRKRSHELVYSISSFILNANNNTDVEYIVVIDPDDVETEKALEKISRMCCVHDASIIYCVADKRYGYEELEQYQNLAGKVFTGEGFLIMNDDIVCLNRGWDDEVRKVLSSSMNEPKWLGLSGINERWKGSTTFVGINRKWYDVVGRVSGNRATDSYLSDIGKAAGIEPLRPDLQMIHLQRGRTELEYERNGKLYKVHGLPDDGMGGYPTKTPKPPKYYHDPDEFQEPRTDFVEGKRRFDEDLKKLKEFYAR